MRADLKARLYELLEKIPFGPQQRELFEDNIEKGSDEWAEAVLEAFKKAEISATKALAAVELYKKTRLAKKRS